MPLRNTIQSLYYYSLFFLAFTISLPFIFSSVAIFLVAICWLLQFDLPLIISRAKERKFIWVWALFFVQTAVSFFYSTDKAQSAFDIQIKLSFIILPIIIGLGPTLRPKNLEKLFAAYIAGLTFVAIICITKAAVSFTTTSDVTNFYYHSLVTGFDANAVYYAVYTLFALTILLIYHPFTGLLHNKIFRYTCLIVLLIFLILLSSRLLLLLFVILLIPIYFLRTIRSYTFKFTHLLGIIGIVALLGAITLTNNPIKSRYLEISQNNTIVEENGEPTLNAAERVTPVTDSAAGNKQVFNNLSLRLFLWKIAFDNIKKHNLWWAGCGNGDVKILQKERLLEFNRHTDALTKHPPLWHYNLHNMYIQILMMLGVPGLIVFLLIVFMPFYFARKIRNGLVFILFNTILALFFCQESALQTQAGIILYAFFSQIFLLYYYSEKKGLASID